MSVTLRISGMHCAGCVSSVEQALRAVPGVREVTVQLLTESADVRGELPPDRSSQLVAAVRAAGYEAQLLTSPSAATQALVNDSAARERLRRHRQALVQAIGLTLPILFLEHFHHAMWPDTRISQLLFRFTEGVLLVMLMVSPAGAPILASGLRAAWQRTGNMDLLITLGVLASAVGSAYGSLMNDAAYVHFHAAAMILALVCVGRYLEQRARDRAAAAIASLAQRAPRTALVRRGAELVSVPVEQIVVGDVVSAPAHAAIPTDGDVTEGEAAVDESLMTGEPMPVLKRPGSAVLGGTLVMEGMILYRATSVGRASAIGRILELVAQAQSGKTAMQRAADRVAAVFTPIVLAVAALAFFGWWAWGGSASMAARSAIAVLVVACPCALGLATPVVVMVASGVAALRGILVRNASMLEAMGGIDTVVWDKTGTLTQGAPEVESLNVTGGAPAMDVLRLAAAAEQLSTHPLAQALVRHARRANVSLPSPGTFESRPGQGVCARVEGHEVCVGSAAYLSERGISGNLTGDLGADASKQAGPRVFIAIDGKAAGFVSFFDAIRPSSASAVARLRARGITQEILTGDEAIAARAVADAVGIERVGSAMSPAGKQSRVEELVRSGRRVAMVGDGVNDAAALAGATVGVAFAGGADVTGEAAGIHLIGSTPHLVADAVDLARVARRVIRQNLFWAFVYNALMIPFAATGRLPPAAAAAAMALSSLTVVLNALRLPRAVGWRRADAANQTRTDQPA